MTQKGANQGTIQEMNRSLILNVLKKQGICSRAKIAELTGLQGATITYIVNDLINLGYIIETGLIAGIKKRRSIGISLNNSIFRVIGIRLARKYFSVGVFNLSGQLQNSEKVFIKDLSPNQVINQITTCVKQQMKNRKHKFLAVGVGIPGPFISKNHHIALMTGFPGWENINITSVLETAFKIPVFIEHDAKAAALAQSWFADDAEFSDILVYVAAGAGVGAGIVSGQELFKGSLGTAGEIGHMSVCYDGLPCECGNSGCLEKYSSSAAFTESLGQNIDFSTACSLVKQGNPTAVNEYKKACTMLGIGIVNVINVFNPAIIVIGDEMAHVDEEIMLNCVKKEVDSRIIHEINEHLKIKISSIEKGSALVGAGVLAVNEVLKTPSEFSKKQS